MMNSNKEFIDRLKYLYSDLLKIMETNNDGQINYQINKVKYIIGELSECITSNYINSDDIITEIKSIHKSLYTPRGGLAEFYIWKNDVDELVKANEPLDRIKDELWNMLS